MNLSDLASRIEYEQGNPKAYQSVVLMTPDGRRFDVLSLNWDETTEEWVIIGTDE